MKLDRFLFAPACAALMFVGLAACNRDDASVTARAQGKVNLAMSPDSTVQIVVHDGHATLTGMASSETMRTRAGEVARHVEGVDGVENQITLTPVLTGATVPR
jgi:osmotically-inducible protein OsmY